MDPIDQAQRLEQLQREAALRARAAQPRLPAQAGIECLRCGEEIPAARRRALPGACLCVDCQAAAEKALAR